jgi:hypothetical protein
MIIAIQSPPPGLAKGARWPLHFDSGLPDPHVILRKGEKNLSGRAFFP